MLRPSVRLGMALVMAVPVTALGWSREFPYASRIIATGGDGTVFTVVPHRTREGGTLQLQALASSDGRTRWRRAWRGRGRRGREASIRGLAVTLDGDVIAVGSVMGTANDFVVARYDGRSGRRQWRTLLPSDGPFDREEGLAVAVTAAGDVVVGGSTDDDGRYPSSKRLTVALLDSDTGAERWRYILPQTTTAASRVVVAADGSIVASGSGFVVMLSSSGSLRWSAAPTDVNGLYDVAVDPDGNVLVAMETRGSPPRSDFAVAKLAAATGEEVWRVRRFLAPDRWQRAIAVVTDATGAVFAAGRLDDGSSALGVEGGDVFAVMRLESADGAIGWEYRIGGQGQPAMPATLALGPDGRIIAAGYASTSTTCHDAFVVALDAVTGTVRGSETIDGSLVAADCVGTCYRGGCSTIDDDEIFALSVDASGGLTAAGTVVDGTLRDPDYVDFVRRLDPLP